MIIVNVSLPEKLKRDAQKLIEQGLFVSFSDLVRHSLRGVVEKNRYELMADLAAREAEKGEAVVLETRADIKKYFDNL